MSEHAHAMKDVFMAGPLGGPATPRRAVCGVPFPASGDPKASSCARLVAHESALPRVLVGALQPAHLDGRMTRREARP